MIFSLLSSLCWSLFDIARKELAQQVSPKFLSLAMSISVLPLFFFLWGIQGFHLPSTSYYIPATISGVLAAIGSVCFMLAISKGKLAIVLSITACTPFISAVFSLLFLDELLSKFEWLGIVLVVFATMLLAGTSINTREKSSSYALLTAFAWGICIVFDKQALTYGSSSFHGMFLTSTIIAVLSISLRVDSQWRVLLKNFKWWLIAVMMFFGAVFLQFAALEYLNPGVVEAIKRGIGIVLAVIIGRVYYQETLSSKQVMGVCLVLVATYLFM
ncbi:SMR family transporter [Pseudoalteromonas phenolica]|uniref:EamA domain-containing protein n=1 Tax=Pseudoalteromonas phenolica TaxID=161398 RepID=A0A0S2K8U3_9GAMM|nr:SMR family transporter [Pseudoalteromonas phenolica]ALO44613.1 hypothetical protein PP2015_4146 [Pseudoalteromonas phenolica]MBE0357645.1 hypothetical protein [Pseudoalteromonas phenolica O-BC30]RXF02635.1 DMT family transporter [Pseudoalteromonas phenolica O-BC30]